MHLSWGVNLRKGATVFKRWRRQRALGRVKPGDGHALKPYRWWEPFSRSLFFLHLRGHQGEERVYAVSVPYWDDEEKADLYLDGQHHATSSLPAAFPVPGGVIEVATSLFGLKRCHFVPEAGPERQLQPEAKSGEGLRARLDQRYPRASRWVGVVSALVLLAALVLGLPQLVEWVTQWDLVAGWFGTFTSPISLPAPVNTALGIAAICASIERALRLRYHWLLDGDFDVDL